MTVPLIVSWDAIQAELTAVKEYAAAAGLPLDLSSLTEQSQRFYVTFQNIDGESFVAEFDCTDYPMYPPTVEFVGVSPAELKRSKRAVANRAALHLYPSCFHSRPCVCMRYNRKAYGAHGGPHSDWRMVDWQLPTTQGVAVDTLALIVSDLHSKIASSRGRLGP